MIQPAMTDSQLNSMSRTRSPSHPAVLRLRLLLAAATVLAAILVPGAARAVEIKQTVWGFDGQIVMQRFNLFSVLVDNPAANAFEGTVRLKKLVAGKQVDAVIVEEVYLAPYSSRWVQFYPYIKSDWDNWEVSWGPSGPGGASGSSGPAAEGSFAPPNARPGKPAAVLLDDPDAIPQAAGAIKRLPDNLFPPHSTATDCLAAVVLDHVPRWDTARQRSFLEWLKRGGRAYLLHTLDAKLLEFTGELAALNGSGEEQQIGSGSVYRLERTRRQLDAPFVDTVIAGHWKPAAGSNQEIKMIETIESKNADELNQKSAAGYQFSHFKWEVEGTILAQLKRMSNPDHSWGLFFLLGLVYLGMVFPGCYAIGQKYSGDFRKTFGFLLAMVGIFSLLFLVIGRRGYDEVTVVHSLAIARQLPGGTLDVTQWSNAFVTAGGNYSLAHAGTGRIYSSCQDQEIVLGEIRNGPDAHLLADIPPFSSRPFSHRALVPAKPIVVEVEEWTTRQDQTPITITARDVAKAVASVPSRALENFTLRKGDFPPLFTAPGANLYALYGRHLYRLKENGDRIELASSAGALATLLQTDKYSEFGVAFDPWSSLRPGRSKWREPRLDEMFEGMFHVLLTRSLELVDQQEVEQFSLPPDRARLLIYAPLPESLLVADPRFSRQHGRVLYCLDIFQPEPK
jgi:hypothetical protein